MNNDLSDKELLQAKPTRNCFKRSTDWKKRRREIDRRSEKRERGD